MGLVLRIRIGCKKHCSGIIEASVNPVIVRKKRNTTNTRKFVKNGIHLVRHYYPFCMGEKFEITF